MVLNFIFGLYRVIFGFILFGILIVFFLFMIFIYNLPLVFHLYGDSFTPFGILMVLNQATPTLEQVKGFTPFGILMVLNLTYR